MVETFPVWESPAILVVETSPAWESPAFLVIEAQLWWKWELKLLKYKYNLERDKDDKNCSIKSVKILKLKEERKCLKMPEITWLRSQVEV